MTEGEPNMGTNAARQWPQQQRPDPMYRLDGAFFWKACERGELVAQECNGCHALWHPPRPICPACHSIELGEAQLTGRGTILSWGRSVHPRAYFFDESPITVLVELEEGVRMVSTLEGVALDRITAGMLVMVDFVRTRGGKMIHVFQPLEEGQ